MTFIGVICEHFKFDIIKKSVQEKMNKSDITLININKNSIKNLKNVRFDVIVIMEKMEDKNDKKIIMQICKNLKYLIVNSDIEITELSNIKTNIITFGLNHKSTVTFSSITDDMILVSVQRSFFNTNNKLIEVGEYEMEPKQGTNLYGILVEFIIKKLCF